MLALLVAGALTMAACGTDTNTTTSNSSASSSAAPSTSSAAVAPAAAAPSSAAVAGSSAAAPAGSAATFASAGFTCATGSLRSSGSTAQGSVIATWIKDYNAKCSATINAYGGGGSGKGVSDFTSNQVDFGGSDSALKEAQFTAAKTRCAGSDAIDLPMVTGPIAVSFNLSGISKLVLTPKIMVGIFGGSITNWNSSDIAAVNPGVTLPNLAIATVHRSEASGTTDNFTKYLTKAGGWTFTGGKSWTAPGGTGAQGSDGVAKAIASTTGSIGYVEWGYALSNKLAMAEVDNGSGAVALTADSAGKTVASAKVVGTGKDLSLSIDYATKAVGAYPVVLVTYEVLCSGGNADKAALLKSFLGYTATDGQAALVALGAAPLPPEIAARVIAAVTALS